ncbi:MAG: lysoplasmalogenase [Anaerolineae bacterium]|nr:lysoplasmalogenase [Anaerolineae bacterium]
MLTISLVVLVILCAALTIAASYRDSQRQEYIFKPLTTTLIILIALSDTDPISTTYHVLIVAGLVASLAGDVFLMLPPDYFVRGLISFLFAHIFYIIAFTVEGDGTAPFWTIIPFVVYGVIILWRLWPDIGSLKIPVMVYITAILIMAWQAANRWLETEQNGSLLALAGAYLFVASDSVLAVERFKHPFRSARFWVLSSYFAAQTLIALSI